MQTWAAAASGRLIGRVVIIACTRDGHPGRSSLSSGGDAPEGRSAALGSLLRSGWPALEADQRCPVSVPPARDGTCRLLNMRSEIMPAGMSCGERRHSHIDQPRWGCLSAVTPGRSRLAPHRRLPSCSSIPGLSPSRSHCRPGVRSNRRLRSFPDCQQHGATPDQASGQTEGSGHPRTVTNTEPLQTRCQVRRVVQAPWSVSPQLLRRSRSLRSARKRHCSGDAPSSLKSGVSVGRGRRWSRISPPEAPGTSGLR